jgi:hypothetical protein
VRPHAIIPAALCVIALAITGCGNTLQDQPVPHNTLEGMIVTRFPVYWLGATFQGLALTEASHDPSGGFSIQYGDCLQGGQSTCVTPLRIITSPNNSFVPGGTSPGRVIPVRGVFARFAAKGRTIMIPAGPVVVDIYASDARVARAAAETAVPINEPAFPYSLLPAPSPDTGYSSKPLPDQIPAPLRPLHRPRPRAPVRRRVATARRSQQGAQQQSSG